MKRISLMIIVLIVITIGMLPIVNAVLPVEELDKKAKDAGITDAPKKTTTTGSTGSAADLDLLGIDFKIRSGVSRVQEGFTASASNSRKGASIVTGDFFVDKAYQNRFDEWMDKAEKMPKGSKRKKAIAALRAIRAQHVAAAMQAGGYTLKDLGITLNMLDAMTKDDDWGKTNTKLDLNTKLLPLVSHWVGKDGKQVDKDGNPLGPNSPGAEAVYVVDGDGNLVFSVKADGGLMWLSSKQTSILKDYQNRKAHSDYFKAHFSISTGVTAGKALSQLLGEQHIGWRNTMAWWLDSELWEAVVDTESAMCQAWNRLEPTADDYDWGIVGEQFGGRHIVVIHAEAMRTVIVGVNETTGESLNKSAYRITYRVNNVEKAAGDLDDGVGYAFNVELRGPLTWPLYENDVLVPEGQIVTRVGQNAERFVASTVFNKICIEFKSYERGDNVYRIPRDRLGAQIPNNQFCKNIIVGTTPTGYLEKGTIGVGGGGTDPASSQEQTARPPP